VLATPILGITRRFWIGHCCSAGGADRIGRRGERGRRRRCWAYRAEPDRRAMPQLTASKATHLLLLLLLHQMKQRCGWLASSVWAGAINCRRCIKDRVRCGGDVVTVHAEKRCSRRQLVADVAAAFHLDELSRVRRAVTALTLRNRYFIVFLGL